MLRGLHGLGLVSLASLVVIAACGKDGGSEGDGTGSGTESTGDDGGATGSGDDGSTGGGDGTGDDGSTGGGSSTGGDGGTGGGDVVAFRFSEMYIRDPHFYVDLGALGGCLDITDMAPLVEPVNTQLNNALSMDADDPPDGILDLNFLLLFRPLDQAGSGGDMDFAVGECSAPVDTTECDAMADELNPTTYANTESGTCLEPDMAELSSAGYTPEAAPTTGPCFAAGPVSITLNLGDFSLPLSDADIAAQYMGDPADGLVEGLVRGFLSEADAEANTLPADLPVVGGATIASLIPGGAGSCAGHDDLDDNGGTSGWWVYANFTATQVPYTGP